MRVECEACRALVVASFEIDGATVRATCPVCRHVMRMAEAPSAVPPEAPEAAPATASTTASVRASVRASVAAPACPKCGAPRADQATACPACGLTVARMAGYIAARDAAVPEAVRDAWARTAAAWNDEARHDELLQRVATNDAYAWAAGRYRTRGGDAIARRQLDRLRRAAEAALLASATVRPDATARPYRATRRVLAVLIATIAAGAVYATVLRDQASPANARSIPARQPGLRAAPPSVAHQAGK